MFGAESVESVPQQCGAGAVIDPQTSTVTSPGCPGDVFWLYDFGTGGDQRTQQLALRCVRCRETRMLKVVPSMNEGAAEPVPYDWPAGHPKPPDERQLVCLAQVQVNAKLAPKGRCHSGQFRVFDRGNEVYSSCVVCRHQDELGLIGAALGK